MAKKLSTLSLLYPDTNHYLILICILLLLFISYILYYNKECPVCKSEQKKEKEKEK